jgi:hypothetical protein
MRGGALHTVAELATTLRATNWNAHGTARTSDIGLPQHQENPQHLNTSGSKRSLNLPRRE